MHCKAGAQARSCGGFAAAHFCSVAMGRIRAGTVLLPRRAGAHGQGGHPAAAPCAVRTGGRRWCPACLWSVPGCRGGQGSRLSRQSPCGLAVLLPWPRGDRCLGAMGQLVWPVAGERKRGPFPPNSRGAGEGQGWGKATGNPCSGVRDGSGGKALQMEIKRCFWELV